MDVIFLPVYKAVVKDNIGIVGRFDVVAGDANHAKEIARAWGTSRGYKNLDIDIKRKHKKGGEHLLVVVELK